MAAFGALPPLELDPAETNGEVCPLPAVRNSRGDRLSWWKVAIRPAFRKWLWRAIIHAQRISRFNLELMPKRLELLSDLVPQARVLALLVDPSAANTKRVMTDVQEAARAKGVLLHIVKASSDSEIDAPACGSFTGL